MKFNLDPTLPISPVTPASRPQSRTFFATLALQWVDKRLLRRLNGLCGSRRAAQIEPTKASQDAPTAGRRIPMSDSS